MRALACSRARELEVFGLARLAPMPFRPNKDVAAMNPRLSVLPLFAAVALIPSVLASVARAQAPSSQTYEEKKREADWLAAHERISANDDSSNPSKMGPSDLAYLERARALVKAND